MCKSLDTFARSRPIRPTGGVQPHTTVFHRFIDTNGCPMGAARHEKTATPFLGAEIKNCKVYWGVTPIFSETSLPG